MDEKYFEIKITFNDVKNKETNESYSDFQEQISFKNLSVLELMGVGEKIKEVISGIIKEKKIRKKK